MCAVNTPPAKAGCFGLRLKAGLIGRTADGALSQDWERAGVRVQVSLEPISPHPSLPPTGGEKEQK